MGSIDRSASSREERFAEFYTEIDEIDMENEQLIIRGKNLCEMINEMDIIDATYHTLLGKELSEVEKRLLNASLVSIHVGHQVYPPTIHAPRMAASTGAGVAQCLAAGFASSGELHLGAIKNTMNQYKSIETILGSSNFYDGTRKIVGEKIDLHEMIFGFGHPYMNRDPRPDALRALISKLGYETKYIIMHDAIRDELYEKKGRFSNVDGINGALLLSMGFEPEHGEGLFLISRGIGMLAHIAEEYKRPFWSAWGSLVARNMPGMKEKLERDKKIKDGKL